MNFVADLLAVPFILPTVRRSSVGSFVERDFFNRILFQVYFDWVNGPNPPPLLSERRIQH
jgi:hypothetical protein